MEYYIKGKKEFMEICQYEFTFQDEYMEILDKEVSDLLEISDSLDDTIRVDKREHSFEKIGVTIVNGLDELKGVLE